MTTLYKIGGKILDDEQRLRDFCRRFAAFPGPKLLVHGGNVLASRVQEALGVPVVKLEGRRVTDADTLQVVTMVYAGWYNKLVTSMLQAEGCNAIGLSGCDGSVITAHRRPPITLSDGRSVDFGFVGDVNPQSVRVHFVQSLLDQGIVPVFCAINHDGNGQLLNTNADTVAASVAAAMGARLVYCFEMDGVLMDKDDPTSVLPEIDLASFGRLKASGVVSEGMLPKLETAFGALRAGVPEVYIGKTHICL